MPSQTSAFSCWTALATGDDFSAKAFLNSDAFAGAASGDGTHSICAKNASSTRSSVSLSISASRFVKKSVVQEAFAKIPDDATSRRHGISAIAPSGEARDCHTKLHKSPPAWRPKDDDVRIARVDREPAEAPPADPHRAGCDPKRLKNRSSMTNRSKQNP